MAGNQTQSWTDKQQAFTTALPLQPTSDESSPALKELKQKIQTIERALKYLKDNGLAPDTTLSIPNQTD